MSYRKAYVRVVETIDHLAVPLEIIAGVELDTYYPVSDQYQALRRILRYALTPSMLRNFSDASLAESVEEAIKKMYPGRSYFIEIGRGNLDEYVQVFHP